MSKNIIIVGCGHVGARLAGKLSDRGYKVKVIDDQQNYQVPWGWLRHVSLQAPSKYPELCPLPKLDRQEDIYILGTPQHVEKWKEWIDDFNSRAEDPTDARTLTIGEMKYQLNLSKYQGVFQLDSRDQIKDLNGQIQEYKSKLM